MISKQNFIADKKSKTFIMITKVLQDKSWLYTKTTTIVRSKIIYKTIKKKEQI